MRVLVCGGRECWDYTSIQQELNDFSIEITEIIEGGARGADACAHAWALLNGVKCTTVNADWDKHGKAAGPIRNAEMLKLKPDYVLAFEGGVGTANMLKQARAAGVPSTHFGKRDRQLLIIRK